jgi:hypothetical protein
MGLAQPDQCQRSHNSGGRSKEVFSVPSQFGSEWHVDHPSRYIANGPTHGASCQQAFYVRLLNTPTTTAPWLLTTTAYVPRIHAYTLLRVSSWLAPEMLWLRHRSSRKADTIATRDSPFTRHSTTSTFRPFPTFRGLTMSWLKNFTPVNR